MISMILSLCIRAAIVAVLFILLSSCASWQEKDGRWFSADEAALCHADKVDPEQWTKIQEWQGVPKPSYDKVQSAWGKCYGATLNLARDIKNDLEANKELRATWTPKVQAFIDTVAYLALLALVGAGYAAAANPVVAPFALGALLLL